MVSAGRRGGCQGERGGRMTIVVMSGITGWVVFKFQTVWSVGVQSGQNTTKELLKRLGFVGTADNAISDLMPKSNLIHFGGLGLFCQWFVNPVVVVLAACRQCYFLVGSCFARVSFFLSKKKFLDSGRLI